MSTSSSPPTVRKRGRVAGVTGKGVLPPPPTRAFPGSTFPSPAHGGKGEGDGRGRREDTWETRQPSFGLRRGKESQGGLLYFRGSGQPPFSRCPYANSRLAFPATASIFFYRRRRLPVSGLSLPAPASAGIPPRARDSGRGRERREKGR